MSFPCGLFQGLKIMEAGENYTSEMGKYPVIFLTLKSARTGEEGSAFQALENEIAREFDRHGSVLESAALSEGGGPSKSRLMRISPMGRSMRNRIICGISFFRKDCRVHYRDGYPE